MAQARLEVTMQGQGLQTGLTQWQKSLGLVRDSTGRLFNAQQQWVEGLSRSQIEMGLYRNGLDQIINQQGQLVTGLQAWEIQLGRYTDILGNVYERTGNLVRMGAQQISINSQLAQSLRGIGMPLLQIANTYALLGENNRKALTQSVAFAGAVMSTVQPIQQAVTALNTLRTATQAQGVAQVFLNAVSGNWVSIAAGIVAAGGIATTFAMAGDEAQTAADKVQNLNNIIIEFNKISLQNIQKTTSKNDLAKAYDDIQTRIKQAIESEQKLAKLVTENSENYWTINSWTNSQEWRDWFDGIKKQNEADLESAKAVTTAMLKQKDEIKKEFEKFGKTVLDRNMSESEKLLKQYTSDLKTANAAFSLAQEETEKEYWKKVIESLKEEYKDKSTKKEREAAEKAQQEEQKKYNTTLEEATKYIRSQLPERERKDIELNEQLERYKKALADTADKQSEQAKKLQNAIDAVEANIVANNQSEWIQTKINKEREKFIQDEKERQERLKALQTADAGGDKIYGEMLKETQKSMLGEWNQYFETKKTGIEEFEDGAKKLVEAAVKAGKTPEQISDAFDRYADNFLKQQEKEKEQKQQSEQTASAATRYSAEAMKIVAQTSKPEITAIDKGSQKIVNSVNKLQTSIAGVKTAIINNKTVIESTI